MNSPFLSVVTPTHNRRDSVMRLLEGLRNGTHPSDRFEVIVVADGCMDDTVAALHATAFPFTLTVLEQLPGRGAASARSLGATHARGDVLVFIDDDIEPLPALLETHARLHTESDDLVMVGAPIPTRAAQATPDQVAAWAWWEQQFERMARSGHRFTYDEVFSGILSVRARRFAAVGGFQPQFDNCRDDSELGYRLFHDGGSMAFSRDAGGIHHEIRNHERLVLRKRAEGRADVLLAEGHPELWPALRLSWPLGRVWSPLGIARRLAFAAPRLGDLLASLMLALLRPVGRLGMHATWRAVEAGAMYYNYWRGVATHLGGRSAFDALAARVSTEASMIAARADALDLDLSLGLGAAERALDVARPQALHIRFGVIPLGALPYVPGAEPLRGRHLRRALATTFAVPLGAALAVAWQEQAGPRAADVRTDVLA